MPTPIHTTAKLAKQAKKIIQPLHALETGPLGKWKADLFYVARKKCWLITNALTRYTVIIPDVSAADLPRIPDIFVETLHDQFLYEGIVMDESRLRGLLGQVVFMPSDGDRPLAAVQNQRISALEYWKFEFGTLEHLPVKDLGRRMNGWFHHTDPTRKRKGFTSPIEEMRKVLMG